jgi:hypothetical protein
MKKIILSNTGNEVLVDDEDYDFLNRFHWHESTNGYAATGDKCLYMHRLVLGVSNKEVTVDHVNGKRIRDNRKQNLRKATPSQQQANSQRRVDNTTGYKGVTKRDGRYIARLGVNGKRIHIGNFNTAIEAAKAYDETAKLYYGEYSNTNF